jgi:hypothetical protein
MIFRNKPGIALMTLEAVAALCFLASAPASASAKDVLLAWDRLDGNAAGYKVYWGQSSRAYDYSADAGTRTDFIVRGLQGGITYYFATTAYDSNHNESDFSDEAVLTTSTAPSGSSVSKAGCFIATAAYGSNFAPEVQALRDFRDAHLITNPAGRLLVNAYYGISPAIADFIRDSTFLRALTRWILSFVVYAIKNPLAALLLLTVPVAGWLAGARFTRSQNRVRGIRNEGRKDRYEN